MGQVVIYFDYRKAVVLMVIWFKMFFAWWGKAPKLFYILFKDFRHYLKIKGWRNFEGWGIHIYTGRFGASKTSSMVHDAYCLARRYPQVTIVTNVSLQGFPEHTKILPLRSPQDILNAPDNTLVLIDEIGTIFNSRDFAKSKESMPKLLFQHLCQCRHRHMMMFATAQRWGFIDKQIRDISATVRSCSIDYGHPFSRLGKVYEYDALDYDLAYTNPMLPLRPLDCWCYLQTDKIRQLYDTREMVSTLLSMEYISDSEIMANRGEMPVDIDSLDRKSSKRVLKNARKF